MRRHVAAYDAVAAGAKDGIAKEAHDKALDRAANARYVAKEDPSIKGSSRRTVLVARLPFSATEADVRLLLQPYGTLEEVRLVRDVVTGASRGYAFATFAHARQCDDAVCNGRRLELQGHRLLIDYEREREADGWVPRRLGGGLGGRKESGQLRFGGPDRPFRPSKEVPSA